MDNHLYLQANMFSLREQKGKVKVIIILCHKAKGYEI